MAINSKNKGKTGELEFCKKMREYGYDIRRSVQYCGNGENGEADVVGLEYIHCEIKRVERLNIDEAIEQAIRDTKDDKFPAVFHRKNRKSWLVTMPLEYWIQIYNEYYSGIKMEELNNGL